jgi:hypothetical protein
MSNISAISKKVVRKPRQQSRENLLPELLKRVPNSPPTINKSVFQARRYRHVGAATSGFSVNPLTFNANFGVPTNARIQVVSVTAWAKSDPSVPNVILTLVDNATGKSFTDSASIGQPCAKVGFRLPLVVRQVFAIVETSATAEVATVTSNATEVTIDVVIMILQA